MNEAQRPDPLDAFIQVQTERLATAIRRAYAAGQLNRKRGLVKLAADIQGDCPTIAEIKQVVSQVFAVSIAELESSRRGAVIARPRQIAMYLAKELTPHTLPAIGRHFRRDHTTVIHAIARIKELAAADPDFGARIATLRAQLDTS